MPKPFLSNKVEDNVYFCFYQDNKVIFCFADESHRIFELKDCRIVRERELFLSIHFYPCLPAGRFYLQSFVNCLQQTTHLNLLHAFKMSAGAFVITDL